MKRIAVCASLLLIGWTFCATAEEVRPIFYEVSFKGSLVATQTVMITESAGARTVTTSFEAFAPAFVAQHRIAEKLSVTYDTNDTVTALQADITDGGKFTKLAGTAGADGALRVVREDREGVSTNLIARADYDFNSLTLYGNAPTNFLSTNSLVRVLDVTEGRVFPVTVATVGESYTFERQRLDSTHVIWTEGANVSHSWHPERFSNLPVRYARQTGLGEFTFTLLR